MAEQQRQGAKVARDLGDLSPSKVIDEARRRPDEQQVKKK